ncbi:hypothetical protein [Agathobacter ruminis]|uniref:Uncharacterized protein n=1 Tax=Agathobacter ruminis TaxID=1712665 RepID=A0A2G3E592_9FIRM|nr:hypothetical protein [Agathobacter ruminis]MDC7301113.1 hypothetical protein [Agathobacter ruminis]PHU38424.1 hypothetical protein CSX02_02495 [Agathobacter ruminis]
MKLSYKLFGVFWDQKEIPKECPYVELVEDILSNWHVISLSKILEQEEVEEIKESAKTIVLLIDYLPMEKNTIVMDFFLKRLLQMTEYYHARMVCTDSEKTCRLNLLISNYYKRKTPERSLAQSVGVFQTIC